MLVVSGSAPIETDNQSCMIWDIKDSCDVESGHFIAEGRICISNYISEAR